MNQSRAAVIAAALVGSLAAAGCAEGAGTSDSGEGVAIAESDTGTGQTVPADRGENATAESTTQAGAATAQASDGDSGETVDDGSGPVSAATVEVIGEPGEFSTDLGQPEDDRGVLNVNSAYITTETADHLAGAGNKLVVVDYEVYFTKPSNLFDNAFRLNADGEQYSALTAVNVLGNFGAVYNDSLVFEVPAAAETFEFEGGIPAGTPGGLTAVFGLVFDPGAPAPALVAATGLVEDADAEEITGEPAVISTDITGPERATLTIGGARITGRDGDFFAHEGTKLVVVDFSLSDFKAFGNVFDTAFRLQADDEWYSPLNSINELGNVGDTVTTGTVFEVPASATSFVFEAGPPTQLMKLDGFPDLYTENPSATWTLVFP